MGDEAPAPDAVAAPSSHAATTTATHSNPAQGDIKRRESGSTIAGREGPLNDSVSHHGERNDKIPLSRAPTSLDMQQYFVSRRLPQE
jgi:hypothetical protein